MAETQTVYALFAVVKADGTIRRRTQKEHSGLYVYDTASKAKNNCRHDGDSVVELVVDLSREPLFIRNKRVVP